MTVLTVMLLTYARTEYAVRTLQAFLANARFDGELRVHIADDGSDPEHVDQLYMIATNAMGKEPTVTNAERGGYGKSYNMATHVVHDFSDVVLPLEDDWELLRQFDFTPLVDDLLCAERFGCMRLGYIGYTQPLRSEFLYHNEHHYLLLDPQSPEPHVFSGNPRLETVDWQRKVGLWPEGLHQGETEFAVAHIPAARAGVVWPIEYVHPRGDLFGHIGSVQA